jgi:hypothetical protein
MLIYKGPSVGDVVTIKLTSGEELIAKLENETDVQLRLAKPKVLVMGQSGIGLSQYVITIDPDQSVNIAKSTIVIFEVTDNEYATQYLSATSGIKLV